MQATLSFTKEWNRIGGLHGRWAVSHTLIVVGTLHLKLSAWLPKFHELCLFQNAQNQLGTVLFIWAKIAQKAHLHIAGNRFDYVSA